MSDFRARRNVFVLTLCQILFNTGRTLVFITSPGIGHALAENKAWATAPITVMLVGTALGAMPAAQLMRRIGRRAGFAIGSVLGTVSGGTGYLALTEQSFFIFLVATFLFGLFSAFGHQYRFAAADVAPDDFQSKAISLVLAGGVVAAFTGPELARLGREWLGGVEFLGTYVLLTAVSVASGLIVLAVDIPKLDAEEAVGPQRSLGAIMRAPIFIVAAGTATLGYLVMNLLMTSTPLAMQLGSRLQFDDVALVLEWHIFAMFAPGFFTGSLIRRFGTLPIIAVGNALALCGVVAGLAGESVNHFWLALFLIGFGWNFAFTGGSALLVQAHTPAERAKVQGANDFIIAAFMSLSSLVSGMLYHVAGWTWVNLATLPLMAAALAAVIWLAYLERAADRSAT